MHHRMAEQIFLKHIEVIHTYMGHLYCHMPYFMNLHFDAKHLNN